MIPDTLELPANLQRMVNAGVSGLDIMHGELKNLMLIAEQDLASALEQETLSEEAMDSMVRTECTHCSISKHDSEYSFCLTFPQKVKNIILIF